MTIPSRKPDRVPFNRASAVGNELDYMSQAVLSGRVCGNGPFTKHCEGILQAEFGVPRVLLTTSCTHALEMAALLCDIGPGDEVIVPAYTFVSTANAFVLRGATPIFIDIRPDTLNLDERFLEECITPRTKAVVPVHYSGVSCEMDAILDVCHRHGVAVVEDNAHGMYGKYRERWLGTLGAVGALSFHETKNFTCGEGGALVVNDPRLCERAEIIREKGTDRTRFLRGQVEKYTWVDVGSSYVMADVLAAFLRAQLEAKDEILQTRRRIFEYYCAGLADWAADNAVQLPLVPPHCQPSYHLFYLIMPSLGMKHALMEHLAQVDIATATHYVPLHRSTMAQHWRDRLRPCPVAESVGERLLRLPFFRGLTEEEQRYIVDRICEFRGGVASGKRPVRQSVAAVR